ncbi:4-hydroxy-tetrahydrodipicolinate synthase [Breznakiella homolactica]|uniref:4-hydroxy-tetrahydrodipicolinate synthase n=1 Tax=Breznakiella homolactica TaxID=2798577 RepID=A0A7T7XQT9_9SPIR|nr:4-hydroxy-tetrahydrodipicolinate synthase [Breznakiella homolactica]QQO10799.1 4-hydroxy-tetrahydrodipicolinate synthase [Breznakiella homolactica]
MIQLRGAYTALITPMQENGDVDFAGLRDLIRFQISEGIDGILPLGTTGETPTLEREEQDKIIETAAEAAAGTVPVIIGTGSNSTKHTIENTKRAKELGADIALVVTPYYNKPNDGGLLRHFETVAAAVDIPILIYNIASRTARNIPPVLMEQISRIPTVIGIKESSADIPQIGDMVDMVSRKRRDEGRAFSVLSGDDAFTLPLCALGGDGIISVISNLVPRRVAALTKACLSGNFEEARKLHYGLLPLVKGAFIETNPVPIKTAMAWAGLPAGPVRLPLGPMAAENETLLRQALEASQAASKVKLT